MKTAQEIKKILVDKYATHIIAGPLNGKLVIGFSCYLSAPIAMQSLTDQGALCIKIEPPGGDPARIGNSSAVFNSLAHEQLSIVFDKTSAEDEVLLKTLLYAADAIIDNRSEDARNRDFILQAFLEDPAKQRTVYCTISAYPFGSKESKRPGADITAQAASGLTITNSTTDRGYVKIGFYLLDIVTGLYAAFNVATNLIKAPEAELKHNVVHVATSLVGVAMWLQAAQVIKVIETGQEIIKKANEDTLLAPFSIYSAKDGPVAIGVLNDRQFRVFCLNVLENNFFYEKYSLPAIERAQKPDFENELNAILCEHPREHWVSRCLAVGIPASSALTLLEATQQSFFQQVLEKSADGNPVITTGMRSSIYTSFQSSRGRAPKLNEHKDEIQGIVRAKL